MLNTIVRTGSISQDALRLGFQTTCNKGIARLLKVDDITLQECNKFEKEHDDKVRKEMVSLETAEASRREYKFKESLSISYHAPNGWFSRWLYYRKVNKQVDRIYTVKIVNEGKAQLDLNDGLWRTSVEVLVTTAAWSGMQNGRDVTLKKESFVTFVDIVTRAMICVVDYTQYDSYNERYIPDEAAQAAYEALEIGMEKILVAFPRVHKSVEPDPIIVGHVGDQMFILAWFGYDKKDHMSCNM